ncbi:MAG: thioesterase [Acutalibacteraceae bacterium]|nr:thioesterase [Acutalibacteraceae bacterium]
MAFEFKTEVTAHDIDTNCFATPTSTVKYMMEAVDRNMLCCGPTYQELMEKGLSFIVSRTAVEVLRPLKEYEQLTVSTWATPSKNVSFPRSYEIRSGGEVVAKGLAIWALVDLKEHKLVKGTDFSVDNYGTGDAIELGIPSRFKLPSDISFTKCGEKKVLYSDIDRNFHMNNTKYFDMMFDYIPERERIFMSSCLINYVGEAPFGKTIDIYISEPVLEENGEKIYYFKTEIDGNINIQAKAGVRYII